MRGQRRQSYEYHLTLLNVRMKVKFPCRMKIQHMGSLVTGQTPISGDNKYIFNQEIILRDDQGQECFQFVINLVTEMGSKYIAGVIKLYHSQMVRSEGEKLVLSLSKCIDSQAFCQIKIDQVICRTHEQSKSRQKRNSAKKTTVNYNQRQIYQVQSPKITQYQQLKHVGSRTQYEYPSANTPYPPRSSFHSKSKVNQKNHNYKSTQKLQILTNQKFYEDYEPSRPHHDIEIEDTGYKQAYLKLKQKYRKQTEQLKNEINNKNLHQVNQNALKLELMKYKIRFQELQRNTKDKNIKVFENSTLNHKIRQLQSENNYLNSQIKKRDNDILRLQDTIQSLTCDLQQLTESLREKKSEQLIKFRQLKLSAQTLRQKLTQKQKELQYFKLDHQQILKQKNQDLSFKNVQIEHDRKLISQLQKNIQAKIFQHQKVLQNQRAMFKQQIEEQSQKVQKLQKQIILLSTQKQQLRRKFAEMEALFAKEEYERKLLTSESQSHRTQSLTLRQFRERFLQTSKQNKALTQKILLLQNQISRLIESKNQNSLHINKQFQDQVEYFRKLTKDSDEKSKFSVGRINQLENHLNQTKGQYQKMRRAVQSANQQLLQLKQREKVTKKNLKERENNSFTIQSQFATLKHKLNTIDEVYKLQINKIKSQISAANGLLEIEKTKNAQFLQKINFLQGALKKNEEKLTQSQKKRELYEKNSTQHLVLIEELKADNQAKQKELSQLNEFCVKKQKQQSFRLHEIEEDLKGKNQKIQKLKRDLKDIEQKYITQVYNLKNQTNEIQNLTDLKAQYEQNLTNFTLKVKQLQNQLQNKKNQQSRLSKHNDHLKQELETTRNSLKQRNIQLENSLKQRQDIKQSLDTTKKENSQLIQKLQTFKKEYQRFKQNLAALDAKYLSSIYLKQEKESNIVPNQQTTFNELLLSITNQFKQIKQIYLKKQEQIALEKRENQTLREQMLKLTSTVEVIENKRKTQINQLQGQIERAYYEKNTQSQNFTAIIKEMAKKIQQKESFQENMHNQIQQLNFNINSMKLDFQATNDQNNKKIAQLRKIAAELQQKNKERQIVIQNLEQKVALYAQEISQKHQSLEQYQQNTTKLEKQSIQLKQMLQLERKQLTSLQKVKKQLLQKLNELQFAFISEKEQNEKHKKSLEEQQANNHKLNVLISNLMKEKELGIKKQLQGNDIVTNVENKLLQKQKDLQLLQQQYQKCLNTLESYKENVKSLNTLNKQIDSQLRKSKTDIVKFQQKLYEKDSAYQNREEGAKKALQNYEKTLQKLKNQKLLLQQQLQRVKSNYNAQVKSSSNKIIELESKIMLQKSQNQSLVKKTMEMEEQMFEQYQKIIQLDQNLQEKQKTIAQLKEKISQLDLCLNQVNQELRLKDEKLFGLSDQNYNLELKLQAGEQYRYQQVQRIKIQNASKQQALCQQYETRIEIQENQLKSLRAQLQEKNLILKRKSLEIKQLQQHQADLKRQNEQKLQKIEQERLTAISLKNVEIQKLNDEMRVVKETVKNKQNENRKSVAEMQTLRRTISAVEMKLKQYEEKNSNLIKLQRQESQSFRKKESQFRVFKEAVISQRWNMQRQMKKILQGYVRSFLDISDQKNTNKVIQTLRLLQLSIFQVLNNKNNQLK